MPVFRASCALRVEYLCSRVQKQNVFIIDSNEARGWTLMVADFLGLKYIAAKERQIPDGFWKRERREGYYTCENKGWGHDGS